MEDNNYLETLRLNLIDAYGTDNVPDSATFVSKMSDSKYREDVHFNLVDAYGTDNVPDIKTFNLKIGEAEKKNSIGNASPTGGNVGAFETPSIGNEVAGLLGVKPIKPSQYAVPSPLVEETKTIVTPVAKRQVIDEKNKTIIEPILTKIGQEKEQPLTASFDKSTFDNYNKTFEDYKRINKYGGDAIKNNVLNYYVRSGGVLSDLFDISTAYFSNPNYKEDSYFTNSAYKKVEEEYKKTPEYAYYTKSIQKSKNAFFEAKAKADKETERQAEVIAKAFGGWGSLVTEVGKADVDKIREGVDSFLEKNKIESDSPIAYKLRNELKAQAEFKYIEPEINEEFEAQYKKLYGTTPEEDIKKEYGVTVEKAKGIKAAKQELEKKRLLEDKALEAEFKPEYESLGSSYKAKTTEIDSQIENDSELNSFAQQLGQERQSRYQAMVDKGQMSVEQANAEMNSPASIEEEKKKILQKINEKYGKVYESAFAEYQKSLNEVGSRYKSAYRQQENARVDQANKKIELEIESLKEQFQISPALIEKRKKVYEDAYKKVSDSGLKAEIAAGRTLPFLAQSGMSLLMGLGGGLKGYGAEFDNKFLYDLGESLESDFKINVGESKEFSDWLDSSKLTVGTGNIIGRMLPGMGVTAAAAFLTKDWNLTLRLATTATTSFTAESSDMAGTIRDEVLQRTGDPAKADDAARDMWRSQLYLFPLYGLEGAPYISEFFTILGKKIAPKIFAETARGARKTLGQWAKETAVKTLMAGGGQLTIENIQEFLQNINEEAIRNGKEIKSIADQIDVYREGATLPKFKETIVMVSPSTLIMGATPVFVSSAYNKAKSSYYERSVDNYLNSASISASLETSPEQYLFNINREKGKNFTGTLLNTLFTSGKISESEFDRLSEKMVNMEAYNEVVKKAKVKGNEIGNLVGYRLYDQYISATQAYESEKDEFAKEVLKKQADEAKAQFVNLLQGKGANVSVMTLSNGQEYAFLPDEMMFALQFPNIRESIKNGDIGVVVGGDKAVVGDLLKELESLEQEPQATQQPSQPIITKNTTPTDEKYGTIDRGDGKGVIDLTRAEYEAEVAKQQPTTTQQKPIPTEAVLVERQKEKRDAEIEEVQALRDDLGQEVELINDIPVFIDDVIDRIDLGMMVAPEMLSDAIGELDKQFDKLQKYKNDPSRTHTTAQIDAMIDVLSAVKTEIQDYQLKQSENEQPTKTEPTTEAAPSVEPSQEERNQPETPAGNYEIAQENDVESAAKALEEKLPDAYQANTRNQSTKDLIKWAEDIFDTKFEGDFEKGEYVSWFQSLGNEGYEAASLLNTPKKALLKLKESPTYKVKSQSLLSKEQTPTALSEQLLTPNTNQNEQKSSTVESEKGGNESLRNESPLNEGVQQAEGRQEENVTEQGGVTAPSPKTQQNETKTEQEKPLLEGVRNGGNETQGGQESTELRAETQVQEEVKATIADAVAKFYAIEGKGSQKREAAKAYRQTLEKMPTVKNIFDNIKPIFAQLEREGIITKSKECP